jgi:hypothetical protein
VGGFELPHRLGAFEAFGQKVNQRGIDIVDAISQPQQFRVGHRCLPYVFAHFPGGICLSETAASRQ